MGIHRVFVALAIAVCFACPGYNAAEQRGTEKAVAAALSSPSAVPAKRLGEMLPEPLEDVACRILDIEKSGYFTLTDATYARTEVHREEAVIWTFKVNKPLTCRHAMAVLKGFQRVFFYDTAQGSRQELFVDRTFYSSWIEEGAINRRTLKPDDEFQLWVVLDIVAIRMLRSRGADALEFGKPPR